MAEKTTTEGLLLEAVRKAIAEGSQPPYKARDYVHVVKQLPLLCQRHGLGQTLAYLQVQGSGNPKSPYDLVARQLDHWLLSVLSATNKTALSALSTRDSLFYRETSEQAWLFVTALRRQVEETP